MMDQKSKKKLADFLYLFFLHYNEIPFIDNSEDYESYIQTYDTLPGWTIFELTKTEFNKMKKGLKLIKTTPILHLKEALRGIYDNEKHCN